MKVTDVYINMYLINKHAPKHLVRALEDILIELSYIRNEKGQMVDVFNQEDGRGRSYDYDFCGN